MQVKLQLWPITPIVSLGLPTMHTLEVVFSVLFSKLPGSFFPPHVPFSHVSSHQLMCSSRCPSVPDVCFILLVYVEDAFCCSEWPPGQITDYNYS